MARALRILLPLLAVLAAGGGAAYWYWTQTGNGDGGPVTVYGNVEIREAALAFPLSGRLARITVEEGDRVDADETLAVLERARFEQAVAEAENRVAALEAEVAKLEAGTRPAEIRKARADVEAAEAERDNAQRRLDRLRNLADGQFVPEQEIDDAEAALRTARARLNAAREALNLALEGPREEDITAARARLAAARAERARRREDLADTRLKAPQEGIIRNRLMEPGEMASPQTPVLTLARRDRLWVRAYLPAPRLADVQPGMAATIRTDAGGRFPGRVGHISPTAEFTPKTVQTTEVRPDLVYRIRIRACEPFAELRLGMPVTVTIEPAADGGAPCP